MGKSTPEAFDSSVQKANLWLKDIQAAGHMRSRFQAYSALRCVLHALRDCLRPADVVKLAAQMPLLIRGVFFDGWTLSSKPHRMSREEFMERLRQGLSAQAGLEPLRALRAVVQGLYLHLSVRELEGVRRVLPREVRALLAELTADFGTGEAGFIPRPPKLPRAEARTFSA